MEENDLIFTANNIMADDVIDIWQNLINSIKDQFVRDMYLSKISTNSIKRSVLESVVKNQDAISIKAADAKFFIVSMSFDLNISAEWIEWLTGDISISSGVLKKFIQTALAKNISLSDFLEIVRNSNNDTALIAAHLDNYKEVIKVDNSASDNNIIDEKNVESDIYNALMEVMATRSLIDRDNLIKDGKENIAVIMNSCTMINDSFAKLLNEIDRRDEEIKNLKLVTVAQKKVITALQDENRFINKENTTLRDKVVKYEKQEISRVSLAHKVAEFSGLISEIGQSSIITMH